MTQSKNIRKFSALLLATMAVGTFSACTQSERNISTEAPGTQSEVRGYEDQQRAGVPQQENQRVGDAARVEQRTGEQSGREFFTNLKPGEPINYYTQEFSRMGYDVTDVNRSEDRVTYDLRKGDERFMVSLMTDERNNQLVRDTDVQEYRRMDANQRDQNMNNIVQQIEKLQPGKKPVEYLSQLSKWGQVRQFHSNDDNARVEMEMPNDRQFEVEMQVDPKRQVVTNIDVNENNFWSI